MPIRILTVFGSIAGYLFWDLYANGDAKRRGPSRQTKRNGVVSFANNIVGIFHLSLVIFHFDHLLMVQMINEKFMTNEK
jgi:hypothetical protein